MHLADDNIWLVAGIWMTLAVLSAFISIRLKFASALVEIVVGVFAGNLLGLHGNLWINFVAGFGSIMLTFLAGAQIDGAVLRKQARPAAVIGLLSFLVPFFAALLYARYALHWTDNASRIAGIAMSTASVSVVYSVMLESGLAAQDFGQLVLAACFITDLGTVLALGLLFTRFSLWFAALAIGTGLAMWLAPRLLRTTYARVGDRVSQPVLRLIFAILLILSALATFAKSDGVVVLPSYFLGLACAGFLASNRVIAQQLRSMTLSLLTPFYFLRAGTFVSFAAAWTGAAGIAAFVVVKVIAKVAGVWPFARAFGYGAREANYLTMMMTTGLTFGTISSLYGLTHHDISDGQYSVLVTVVILTAVLPALLGQVLLSPRPHLKSIKHDAEAA